MEAFVVRLWSPAEGWEPVLRGTALHVASGATAVFADAAALVEFLTTGLRQQAGPHLSAPEEGQQLPDQEPL